MGIIILRECAIGFRAPSPRMLPGVIGGPGGCLGLLVTGGETLERVPNSSPIIKVLLPGAICQP